MLFHKVGGDWAEIKDWLYFHNSSSIVGKLSKHENIFTLERESNWLLNSILFAYLGPSVRILEFLGFVFREMGFQVPPRPPCT